MKILGITFLVVGFVNSIYHFVKYSSLIDELNTLLKQKGLAEDLDLITNIKMGKALNLAGQHSLELKKRLIKSLFGIYSAIPIWIIAIIFLGI